MSKQIIMQCCCHPEHRLGFAVQGQVLLISGNQCTLHIRCCYSYNRATFVWKWAKTFGSWDLRIDSLLQLTKSPKHWNNMQFRANTDTEAQGLANFNPALAAKKQARGAAQEVTKGLRLAQTLLWLEKRLCRQQTKTSWSGSHCPLLTCPQLMQKRKRQE